MIFILFNTFGDDFDVITFLRENLIENVKPILKGLPMSLGNKFHTQSGFGITLKNSQTSDLVILEIVNFINCNKLWLSKLAKEQVESAFNIGLTVGGHDAYAPGLEFEVDFLALVSSLKLRLNISCYPTND